MKRKRNVVDLAVYNSAPKVSALMLAYNHERFIVQAIEGFLSQRANFDFELVIGDDASTDSTWSILKKFQSRHPRRLRVLRSERNLGMHKNFLNTLALCRGRYIALIEGDDYWTAPHKLQLQADCLDEHPQLAFCFHRVKPVHENESVGMDCVIPESVVENLDVESMLRSNPVPTCSVMFRRSLIRGLPDWCMRLKILDWPLMILLAEQGSGTCLNEIMAAYRIHNGGLWTTTSHKARSEIIIEMLRALKQHFRGKYDEVIRRRMAETYFHIGWCNEEQGQMADALKANWNAVAADPFGSWEHKINCLRLFARKTVPGFCAWLKRGQVRQASPLLVRSS